MRPGERISLIKRVASSLAEQNYADVELTLDEFKISYDQDFRGGGSYEFVLDAAKSAPDDVLVELDHHLHPGFRDESTGVGDPSGGPWTAGMFRLFVSHTHRVAGFAGQFRTLFRRLGIDAFVAHTAIEPTRKWQDEIESALQTCDAMLALLTPEFRESDWCDQEVGFCVSRSRRSYL